MIHILESEHDLHQTVKAGIREITVLPYDNRSRTQESWRPDEQS